MTRGSCVLIAILASACAVEPADEAPGRSQSEWAVAETTPPEVAIAAPAGGASVAIGAVAVTGTASDAGAGVKLVELCVDGGAYQLATAAAADWSHWSA